MGLSWTDRIEEIPTDVWEGALSRSLRPTPFLSPGFLLPWAEAFAGNRPRRIARWEDGGRTRGLLFLCRRGGTEGWELLGGEDVSDSLDAVVEAGAEARFWAELLGSEGAAGLLADGPLRLPNLVEGSPSLAVLPGVCAGLGHEFRLEEADRSPFVTLAASYEGWLEGLGGKARHELRRKTRRAAEGAPGLSFRVVRTAGELARDFPSFVALHRRSHPEKGEFMDDRMAGFFRAVAAAFLETGRLRLAFLSLAGGDVASAFQIAWDGAFLLYNSGFDPRYRELTPGLLLLSRCIEEAIREGMREYDFLRGRERYKYDLGGRDRIVYRATIGAPAAR